MNKQQEALKLALEALEETLRTLDDENAKPGGAISDTIWYSEHETLFDYIAAQITAIREALVDSALERMAENARELGLDYEPAQQQEPVGEAYLCDKCQTPFDGAYYFPECGHNTATKESVYTSPPASKPWVGLTDEEIEQVCVPLGAAMLSFTEVARAIEAKLREKNA